MRFYINIFVLSFVFIGFIPGSSWASPACYTRAEAEAEQGIRIHSELMVIGLNCQRLDPGDPYTKYREFTTHNERLFKAYEKQIMAYFARQGYQNPEAELHKMRTELANGISQKVALMQADKFCQAYLPRLEDVSGMDMKAVRRWASMDFNSHPVSQPLCN